MSKVGIQTSFVFSSAQQAAWHMTLSLVGHCRSMSFILIYARGDTGASVDGSRGMVA